MYCIQIKVYKESTKVTFPLRSKSKVSKMRLRNKKQKSEALRLPKPPTDQELEASSHPVLNHWLFLSDEMVLYILRLLPHKDLVTVSLVNRQFRDLSRDASLMATLAYEDIKQDVESCRKLVERCNKLPRLKITSETSNPKRSVHTALSCQLLSGPRRA